MTNSQLIAKYDPHLIAFCGRYAYAKVQKHYDGSYPDPYLLASDIGLQKAVSRDVCRVFEGWDAADLHNAWREAKLKIKIFKGIKHPTMRPWDRLEDKDRQGFELFVKTVAERRFIYQRATEQRENNKSMIQVLDGLIAKLDASVKAEEKKSAQDKYDINAERLKYCVDVTRTSFNTFLQAIGLGRLLLNYEHIVEGVLQKTMVPHDLHHNILAEHVGKHDTYSSFVLFYTVRAAADSFQAFQPKQSDVDNAEDFRALTALLNSCGVDVVIRRLDGAS